MPPWVGGVVHLGGVLSASSGDKLRWIESCSVWQQKDWSYLFYKIDVAFIGWQ